MRVQIEFNKNGEIRAIAGPISTELPDGSKVMTGRIPHADHTIIEVEVEEVRHERDFEGCRTVMKSYRVTDHPHKPRLMRKGG